ncbi:MAG: 3-phosphoglycerate dehydrogenase, partial [Kiritimatiellae bacterium]|nr:3-phosphoglycerate dehydrogenase [Kiritimatiellia bacterium]
MKKVLIPTKLDTVAAETLKAHGGYEVVQDPATPLADQVKAHTDAYALIVRSEKVPAEILEALPRLKMVIRAGAGYDNIDIKHARKRGVDVMNTPGANANGVAEEVI